MPNPKDGNGFSLVEALIAAALLAGAITALAHLLTRAVEQLLRTERVTLAMVLAQSKIEQLRAVPFAFDADGMRVDSAALASSAADALLEDSPPHVERLDRFGQLLPDGAEATYVRRWAIVSAPLDPDTVTISACVFAAGTDVRMSDACVWTIRTRQP